jgi:hypothetical protein
VPLRRLLIFLHGERKVDQLITPDLPISADCEEQQSRYNPRVIIRDDSNLFFDPFASCTEIDTTYLRKPPDNLHQVYRPLQVHQMKHRN